MNAVGLVAVLVVLVGWVSDGGGRKAECTLHNINNTHMLSTVAS